MISDGVGRGRGETKCHESNAINKKDLLLISISSNLGVGKQVQVHGLADGSRELWTNFFKKFMAI